MGKRIVATIFVVAVIGSIACKKDGASTTSTSSSAGESLGECKFAVDKAKCINAGKAAFCGMSHDGALKITWQTFTCPDCKASDKAVSCSEFTVGDPR